MTKYFSDKQLLNALTPTKDSGIFDWPRFKEFEKYLESSKKVSANDIFSESKVGKEIDAMIERIRDYQRTTLSDDLIASQELRMHINFLKSLKGNLISNEEFEE